MRLADQRRTEWWDHRYGMPDNGMPDDGMPGNGMPGNGKTAIRAARRRAAMRAQPNNACNCALRRRPSPRNQSRCSRQPGQRASTSRQYAGEWS